MGTSDRYHSVFTVTWSQLHQDTRLLARQLLDKGPFKGIIAVTRGGLVPAAIIAREFDIRLVDTVCIVSYLRGNKVMGRTFLKRWRATAGC